MLLACSGDATSVAVEAMQYLLQEGAVPDTWAPNGSSVSHANSYNNLLKCMAHQSHTHSAISSPCMHLQALMLAASVDGVAAIQLLLKHGATIELQVSLSCLLACTECQHTVPL